MKRIYAAALLMLIIASLAVAGCAYKTYPVTQTFEETRYRTEYITENYTQNNDIARTESGAFALPVYYSWHTAGVSYYAYEIQAAETYDNISLKFSIWKQLQPEPVILRVFDVSATGQIESPEPRSYQEVENTMPSESNLFVGSTSSEEVSVRWLTLANSIVDRARFLGAAQYLWSKAADPQVMVLRAGKAKSIAVISSGEQNRWNARFNIDVLWTRSTVEKHVTAGQRQVARQVPYQFQGQRTVYKVMQVPFWEAVFGSN